MKCGHHKFVILILTPTFKMFVRNSESFDMSEPHIEPCTRTENNIWELLGTTVIHKECGNMV